MNGRVCGKEMKIMGIVKEDSLSEEGLGRICKGKLILKNQTSLNPIFEISPKIF